MTNVVSTSESHMGQFDSMLGTYLLNISLDGSKSAAVLHSSILSFSSFHEDLTTKFYSLDGLHSPYLHLWLPFMLT